MSRVAYHPNERLLSTLTSPRCLCFADLGVDWSAWKLYRELGWGVYKKVSASITLRQLYQRYLILQDLQLVGGFSSVSPCGKVTDSPRS